jgi:hypothetical protein
MAAKHKVTVSTQPANHRPSSSERRAAQIAALSNKQAELKQEAADRAAARAERTATAAPTPSRPANVRRSRPR